MLKKTVIYFTILCAICLLFTTCKRYPEGGWSNVAKKHLFGGHQKGSSKTWHLKKYEVNGIDSTIYITPGNGFTSFENDDIVFKISANGENEAETEVYNYGIAFTSGLNNPKIKKVIKFIGGTKNKDRYSQCYNFICQRNVFNPLLLYPAPLWSIDRLKTNELIIQSNINGTNYKIRLTS